MRCIEGTARPRWVATFLIVGLVIVTAGAVLTHAPPPPPSSATGFADLSGSVPPPGPGSNHTAVITAATTTPRVGEVAAFQLNISDASCGGQSPTPSQYVAAVSFSFGNGAVYPGSGEVSGPTCSGPSPYQLIPFAIAYQSAGTVVVNATVQFLDGERVGSNLVVVTVQPAPPSSVPAAAQSDLVGLSLVLVALGAAIVVFRRLVPPLPARVDLTREPERQERLRGSRGLVTGLLGLAMLGAGGYGVVVMVSSLSRQLLTEIWSSGNPTQVSVINAFLPLAAVAIVGIALGGLFVVSAVAEREPLREPTEPNHRARRRIGAVGAVVVSLVAFSAVASVLFTVPVAHAFSTTITNEPTCPTIGSSAHLANYSIAAPRGALVVYAWQTGGGQALGDLAILPSGTPMTSASTTSFVDAHDSAGYGWFNVTSSPILFGVCSAGPTPGGQPSSLFVTGYYYAPWL